MKSSLINALTLLCLLFLTGRTVAIELVVPEAFVVERLNDETFMPSFLTNSTELELQPGQNLLVLKYSQMFEDELEDHHSTVRSDSFILIFSVTNQQQLKFTYPEQLGIKEANQYAKKPEVSIIDQSGVYIEVINQSLTQFNDEIMKQTLAKQQSINNERLNALSANKPKVNVKTQPETIEQLKFWWNKATAQEKLKFKQFINQN